MSSDNNARRFRYDLTKGFDTVKGQLIRDMRLNGHDLSKSEEEIFRGHANISLVGEKAYVIIGNPLVDRMFDMMSRGGRGFQRVQLKVRTNDGIQMVWAYELPVGEWKR